METGAIWKSVFNKLEFLEKLWLGTGILSDEKNHKQKYLGDFEILEKCKSKIDNLNRNQERLRKAISKGINDYELVSCISRKTVSSRAFYKLYEIVYKKWFMYEPNLTCFFMCEAPGGFIDATLDIRRKRGMDTQWLTQSKCDSDSIEYNENVNNDNILKIGNNDITNSGCLIQTINVIKNKFPEGVQFITADGGIDIDEYNLQEIILTKLIFSEILLALNIQKKGGTFIIKFYDMFCHTTVKLFLLLVSLYKFVKIIKPKTSRICNSERYILCNVFDPPPGWKVLLDDLMETHRKWDGRGKIKFLDFCPNYTLEPDLINRIAKYNNKIIKNQIDAINECFKIIFCNDLYIKETYFNMFFNKPHIHDLILYKNQFSLRIEKSLNWLRQHDIQTSRFFQTNY